MIGMTGRKKIKNFSLHRLKLSDKLQEEWEVIEPDFDKRKLIIATENILNNKITMKQEQHRILAEISPFIDRGDRVYVAGHPALILSVVIVCSIKGAKVYTGLIDMDTKEVIKIEELLFDEKQLDRTFRFDIEHNTTRTLSE